MKFSHVIFSSLIALGMFAFVACDDSSSASSDKSSSSKDDVCAEKVKYDCSVSKGTVVVAPTGCESYKVGDKITVVFGTDVVDASYAIIYRENDEVNGYSLTENSIPASEVVADGKTCNTFEVELDPEVVDPSDEALIVIQPYENKTKMGKSKTFKVEE